LKVAEDLDFTEMPVVYLNIPDIEKERKLNLRLKNRRLDLLAKFNETILADAGFSSDDIDKVFGLEKELEKLNIYFIQFQK